MRSDSTPTTIDIDKQKEDKEDTESKTQNSTPYASSLTGGSLIPAKDPYPESRGLHSSFFKVEDATNHSTQHYLCFSKKRFGIEPGFEAVIIEDFLELYNTLHSTIYTKEEFIAKLEKDKKFLKQVCNFVETYRNKLTVWMFKQDYDEPVLDYVYITASRMREIGRNPSDKRMPTARKKENRNALMECVATDVARCFAPNNTQIAELKRCTYRNGTVKFMTACKIESQYKDLSKYFHLGGAKHDPLTKKGLFENYLLPLDTKQQENDQQLALKTTNIPLIGMYLALHMLMQDRDFIGAYGQNKGVVNDDFFLIDLGKGFKDESKAIVDSVQDNGQYRLPKSANIPIDAIRRHILHRNISILYDTPFKEIMMGFHLLNKMITGKEPPSDIMASYVKHIPEFNKLLSDVKPNSLEKVFEEHIAHLQSLKVKAENDEIKNEYEQYIRHIQSAQKTAQYNGNKLLNTFEKRLQLTADQVELLSNLEKLTSESYDLSSNGKVRISHLQVRPNTRIPWTLEKDEKSKDNNFLLSFKAENIDSAKKCLAQMNSLFELSEEKNLTPFDDKNFLQGSYTIRLTQSQLDNFIRVITEENVRNIAIPLSKAERTIQLFKQLIPLDIAKSARADFACVCDENSKIEKRLTSALHLLKNNEVTSLDPLLKAMKIPSKNDAVARIEMLIYDLNPKQRNAVEYHPRENRVSDGAKISSSTNKTEWNRASSYAVGIGAGATTGAVIGAAVGGILGAIFGGVGAILTIPVCAGIGAFFGGIFGLGATYIAYIARNNNPDGGQTLSTSRVISTLQQFENKKTLPKQSIMQSESSLESPPSPPSLTDKKTEDKLTQKVEPPASPLPKKRV